MKKSYYVLSVILMLFLFLSGCRANEGNLPSDESSAHDKKENGLTVLMYDHSDSTGLEGEIEYQFADTSLEKLPTSETVSFKIGDYKISGNYERTKYLGFNYYPTYQYVDSNNRMFSLDPDGKLVSYDWFKTPTTEKVLSQDECVQIAKDFLANIVDVTPYQISIQSKESSDGDYYRITFRKYIDDIPTSDCAVICVLYSGDLYYYSSHMLGKIPSNLKNEFDMQEVKEAVFSKVNQLCERNKPFFSRIEYSDDLSITLTVLKDGSIGLACSVDIEYFMVEENEELIMPSVIEMIVIK